MKSLESPTKKNSFMQNIQVLSHAMNINLSDVVVTRRCPHINNTFEAIEEDTQNLLIRCLNSWSDAESRKEFIQIMEERVVRLP